MGDIFDGISLEELAGGETVVDPKASGMSQEGDTQNAKNAEEAPATSAKEETSTEVDDPDAIDITELANQGSVARHLLRLLRITRVNNLPLLKNQMLQLPWPLPLRM